MHRIKLAPSWYKFTNGNRSVGVRKHDRKTWGVYFRVADRPVIPTPKGGDEIFHFTYTGAKRVAQAFLSR